MLPVNKIISCIVSQWQITGSRCDRLVWALFNVRIWVRVSFSFRGCLCVCVSALVSGCEREYFSVGYLDTLHKALNNLCNAGPLSLPFNFSRLGWVMVVRDGLGKADLGKLSTLSTVSYRMALEHTC